MKSLSAVLIAAALISGTSVIKSAPMPKYTVNSSFETEDRHLSGFDAVEASGSFDVYITQGNTESVRVEAPADVLQRITTKVEDGTLKIGTKRGSWGDWGWNNSRVVVYINIRNVTSVGLSGSGDMIFKNGLHGNDLKVRLSGSGDITGKVQAKSLESSISGSGDIKLTGSAGNSVVSISGSGDYSAGSLTTEETTVRVSGSGNVHVNANTRIDAAISGSGDVYYSGNARQVNTVKHGSGDVHHI